MHIYMSRDLCIYICLVSDACMSVWTCVVSYGGKQKVIQALMSIGSPGWGTRVCSFVYVCVHVYVCFTGQNKV